MSKSRRRGPVEGVRGATEVRGGGAEEGGLRNVGLRRGGGKWVWWKRRG